MPGRRELEQAGWALPVGFGGDELGARVGTVHSSWWSYVDRRGAVTVPLARCIDPVVPRWCLDWLVGADDRWHVPSAEAGVRQRLVDGAPVVETRLRIPGGDAIQRVFGVRGPRFAGGDEYLVVEVENDTPVPFALAFLVRPFSGTGVDADVRAITITAGEVGAAGVASDAGASVPSADAVRIDDRPVVLLPRRPAHAAGATGWLDVVETVTTGAAPVRLGRSASADQPGLGPTAAVIFPLPHKATLRLLLPLGAEPLSEPPYPGGLPDAARVSNGWTVQARRGARVALPDSGLQAGIETARRSLLLAAADRPVDLREAAALVSALAREGFGPEASAALETWPARPDATRPDARAASSALSAIADHWRLVRDPDLAEALLPMVIALLTISRRVAPSDEGADIRRRIAELLAGIGQVDAALAVEREAERFRGPGATATDAWARLRSSLDAASPTWAWADGVVGLDRFLAAARAVLVDDRPGGLALLPAGVGPWWGQGVELHDAPTAFGPLSFAVRWHGDRPALLWDLREPPDTGQAPGPVAITAPGVDRSWSATDRRGEALLGPLERPPDLLDHASAPIPTGLGGAESVAPRSVLPLGIRIDGPGAPGSESARPGGDRHDDEDDGRTSDEGQPGGSFS